MLKSTSYHTNYEKVEVKSSSALARMNTFTNKWLNITLIVNICFLVLNSLKTEFPIAINYISTFISLAFYFVNQTRYKNKINLLLYLYYVVWVSAYALLSSYSTGLMTYFVVLIALSILLFKDEEMRYKMAILSIVAFVIVIVCKPFLEQLVVYDNPYRSMVHLLITIIVVFYAIRSYATFAESESSEKDVLIEKVKEKNSELERFAYVTSHDLKQPVRNIFCFSGLLERSLKADNTSDKNLEYLDIIKSSSKNLEKLINDILNFSRVDQVSEDMAQVNLNDIVRDQEYNLAYCINAKNAKIEYDNLPSITGNKVYLTLLFQNLIENGIKYNKSENPTVKVTAVQEGDILHINIKDNGIGIEKSFYEEIFMPFKRLHSNREFEGSGLGLSICKKIVEKHNGQISINSEVEIGTEFHIKLPCE